MDHTYFNTLNTYFNINYIKEAYKYKKFFKTIFINYINYILI